MNDDDFKHLKELLEHIRKAEAEFVRRRCEEEIAYDFAYQRFMLKVLEPVK